MVTVDIITQYLVLIVATLLFTVLAIFETEMNPKKIILQFIAGVLWIVSGLAHFIAGDITNILTVMPTYIFMGLGLIFILSALNDAIHSVKGTP